MTVAAIDIKAVAFLGNGVILQPMEHLSQAAQEIFDVAKMNNDAYLVAYRTGYEAGWTAAMKKAMEIISQPVLKKGGGLSE